MQSCITDFTIHVEYGDMHRVIDVLVYPSPEELQQAVAEYHGYEDPDDDHTLGVCHRFETIQPDGTSDPLCAIVRLCEPHLGVGMIAHEFAHAAVWLWELEHDTPLETDNDEEFCWVLGSLVKDCVNTLYDRGVLQ